LCASYHEVRHYLTSVADHEIKKIEQGSYLPHVIISTNGKTNPIQERTDNVDINTKTIDGKALFTRQDKIWEYASADRFYAFLWLLERKTLNHVR
jgi:hypothetical protein